MPTRDNLQSFAVKALLVFLSFGLSAMLWAHCGLDKRIEENSGRIQNTRLDIQELKVDVRYIRAGVDELKQEVREQKKREP